MAEVPALQAAKRWLRMSTNSLFSRWTPFSGPEGRDFHARPGGKVALTVAKRGRLLHTRHRHRKGRSAGRPGWLLALCGLAAVPAAAQQPLGIFGMWGAFRGGGRCYAIAEPFRAAAPEGWRPYVAVGHWPARRISGQLHVRLSRAKRPGSAVLVRIDGRSFQLRGGGRDAWAPDDRADDEILAAMRTGIEMMVQTRSEGGQLVRDQYRLRGAATAMDAAALACRR